MPTPNLLDIAEGLKTRAAPLILSYMKKWKGLDCEVFIPVSNPSVYGQADNQYVYSNTPTYVGKVIIVGWTPERREGDATLDNFQDVPPQAYSDVDATWPRNTLIRVKWKAGTVAHFRVDLIQGTVGYDKKLFRHYLLIPVQAKA